MSEPDLSKHPNALTRKAGWHPDGTGAAVEGYQSYVWKDGKPSCFDSRLKQKYLLLEDDFPYFRGKSFLDLGANGGFFSFLAAQNGACPVGAADMDLEYVALMSEVGQHLGLEIRPFQAKIPHEVSSAPSDVVCALSLVHWLLGMTAHFRRIGEVVGWLAGLTRDTLLVEWIGPTDPAVEGYHHYDAEALQGREGTRYLGWLFWDLLQEEFPIVESLGDTAKDRALYLCRKNNPHSRITINRPLGWVRKKDVAFEKFEALEREREWLERLRMSDVLLEDGALSMPYQGLPLAPHNLPNDWTDQGKMILEGLREANCSHNDIRPDNFCVQGGSLRLIDFGWATEIGEPIPENWPEALGAEYKKGVHDFDDEYSLWKSLEEVAHEKTG